MYFVYLIGSEWKRSSTAGVHLQISEITLLCAGSMVWVCGELTWIISLDVNGKVKVGGFKLSQYTSSLLRRRQVAFQLPSDLSTAC